MAEEIDPVKQYLSQIGRKGGAATAKPTKCSRCGIICRSAREAWRHCLKQGSRPRKKDKA